MTSYLRSWLSTGTSLLSSSDPTPTVQRFSPPPSDDEEGDGEDTETEHDDTPPMFPSFNSAQRSSAGPASLGVPKVLSDSQLMPPPPLPSLARRSPGTSSLSVPSSANSLAVPTTTTKRPTKPTRKREKVALAPGHSPLDWAALKSSGEDLRGVETLMRIPPSVLKTHNKRSDAWSAFNGKVYNITPYLAFHPGGERELMRVAGRDGTELFAATHAWVNTEFMLDACLVGFLVAEPRS